MTKKGPKPPAGDNDDDVWQRVAKTVKPLSGSRAAKTAPSLAISRKNAPRTAAAGGAAPILPARPRGDASGFDRASETRLSKGKMDMEGRIDLHGMTEEEAYRALKKFIARAVKAGLRNLLVITGKGKLSDGGGVLRRKLPLWLENDDLAGHVLALKQAQPKDGGSGAFYLRLRKP